MHKNINRDHFQDKILNGNVALNDFDNQGVLDFLKLLKYPNYKIEPFIPILVCEWYDILTSSKKNSTS